MYSPTLGSATDIQNLEKNGSLAFCENTFMTLNLRKKFFVLKGETFYKEMLRDTEENWPYYSAALVKIQRDFVRERPRSVKDLIRLVKYWHKTFISQTGGEHLLPSYLLELLTIHTWENTNHPERFDMRTGFKAVMEVLQNNRSLHVSWDRYFKRDLIPSRYIHEVFKTSFPRIKGAVFYTLEDTGHLGMQSPTQVF